MTTLRLVRIGEGLSQERAARQAGLSQKMWSRIERGARFADPEQRAAIARVLGVRVQMIFPEGEERGR